jgi:hypothetical protein
MIQMLQTHAMYATCRAMLQSKGFLARIYLQDFMHGHRVFLAVDGLDAASSNLNVP